MTTKQKQSPAKKKPTATSGEELVAQFVHQWNRLVSNTNWEKGHIICDWREALLTQGANVTEYSDEAWAQLVGGVTGQHVGRLRRTFQRFGEDRDQYPGLFWSHFQATLDWDDAPMWLEGAIQNDWSVSEMRGKRWEVLGTPPAQQQAELAEASEVEGFWTEGETRTAGPAEASVTAVEVSPRQTAAAPRAVEQEDEIIPAARKPAAEVAAPAAKPPKRTALNIDVQLLPDDLADAFEQFKLAIIAHRREGWRDTTPEAVCECLDALRTLALAEE